MTDNTIGKGYDDRYLSEDEVRAIMAEAFDRWDLTGQRVLIIIPDGTRTAPIPLFFRLFHDLLGGRVAALDYLIALGTHPFMDEQALLRHVGVSEQYSVSSKRPLLTDHCLLLTDHGIRLFNHRWDRPETFVRLGTISAEEANALTDGMLACDVPVVINKMLLEYDQIIICGPVFPHEVVGFSGGNKYFFPGVSGPEVINFTHWLGALITSYELIGRRHTTVRAVIDRAAAMIEQPKLCFSFVCDKEGLSGLYVGSPEVAWEAASDLSARRHVTYVERPFRQVLSVLPDLYADIWTGAKGLYKVEPVVAEGGEVILYAPHITEFSYTHGHIMNEIGYHVRDYFVKQWDRFHHYPWGVLAHSTHLRGIGSYENDVERPRIRITLATGISQERCEAANLDYRNPTTIDPEAFGGREDEGVLLVRRAGERLYRLKGPATDYQR